MDFLKTLFTLIAGWMKTKDSAIANPPANTLLATPTLPGLDPKQYRDRLIKEVAKKGQPPQGYEPAGGNTYCNYFVRAVAQWFGWDDFKTQDRDQASEMTRYMAASSHWRKLTGTFTYTDGTTKQQSQKMGPDYEAASKQASQGHLVVAAQEGNPHGHVCIISPVPDMLFSNKWGRSVPIAANVGADNWEGKGLSYAFGKMEPDLYLYLG